MGLEAANYVEDLNPVNPVAGSDTKAQGDDHLRLMKTVLKNTFPGFAGRMGRAQSKNGNYGAVLTDNFTLIFFTAGATLSLAAAATLGNGWSCWVYAGGGDVTVDPNGVEEVNGAATATIKQGQMAMLMCTGIAGDEFVLMYVQSTAEIAAAVPPTGVVMPYAGTVAPTNFVMASGRTIGSATSGATERANADTLPLYTLLWNSWSDAEAPVTGGRGASAAADFAANKPLQLPDLRGRTIFGKDNMGGTAANRITNAVSGLDAATLGKAGGDQRRPAHNHGPGSLSTSSDGAHNHGPAADNYFVVTNTAGGTGVGASGFHTDYTASTTTNGAHTHSVNAGTTATDGAGTSENIPPGLVMNWIIKL